MLDLPDVHPSAVMLFMVSLVAYQAQVVKDLRGTAKNLHDREGVGHSCGLDDQLVIWLLTMPTRLHTGS